MSSAGLCSSPSAGTTVFRHSAPFRPRNPTSGEAFVTMDRWLDRARCVPTFLRQPAMAQLVPTSIQYGAEIGHYELHSWVIVPHRVHLLLTPQANVSKLPDSLKAATAKRAHLLLQRSGQPFWQDESYDRPVRDGDEIRRIQRYIEGHPVTALLAARPERYAWSSAGRRPARPPQGVPSMGRILLDERSQSEPMTATVAEAQGVVARRSRKKREANPRP